MVQDHIKASRTDRNENNLLGMDVYRARELNPGKGIPYALKFERADGKLRHWKLI